MDAILEHSSLRPERIAPPNDDVRATVQHVQKIALWMPRGIIIVFVAVPVLSALLHGSIGWALFGGVINYLIARLIIAVVTRLFLRPTIRFRYRAAAQTLMRQVDSLPEPANLSISWWQDTPGAAAITRGGHVVITDYDTDYHQLWLSRDQIVHATVEREATVYTDTREGGRLTLGGVSGGLFGGYTFGGKSRSVSTTVETAFLEIRYQLDRNGPVRTCVIPFGEDRRCADEWRATIERLEAIA